MAEQIFPTKGNLIACKKNLTLAKLGFDLLDRKRNVLMREMMKLIDEAAGMQRAIGDTFIKAYKALESANITLGIEHAPVSYTHLDVYKRQVYNIAGGISWKNL